MVGASAVLANVNQVSPGTTVGALPTWPIASVRMGRFAMVKEPASAALVGELPVQKANR